MDSCRRGAAAGTPLPWRLISCVRSGSLSRQRLRARPAAWLLTQFGTKDEADRALRSLNGANP